MTLRHRIIHLLALILALMIGCGPSVAPPIEGLYVGVLHQGCSFRGGAVDGIPFGSVHFFELELIQHESGVYETTFWPCPIRAHEVDVDTLELLPTDCKVDAGYGTKDIIVDGGAVTVDELTATVAYEWHQTWTWDGAVGKCAVEGELDRVLGSHF